MERLALAQIWAALSPQHRRVLLALAACDDYARAAHTLNLKYSSFCSAVSRARKAFLALWHQHETPSRPWGHDVRGARPTTRTVTGSVLRTRPRQRTHRTRTTHPHKHP